MTGLCLSAEGALPADLLLNLELVAAYVLLLALLCGGWFFIAWAMRRWKEHAPDRLREEERARFRALKEMGALSPEEYERICALLDQSLHVENRNPKESDNSNHQP